MPNVILQPTSNHASRDHYLDTIENPVDISTIAKYVGPNTLAKIKSIYPNGKVRMWGVTPGTKDVNKHKWDRISVGDVTLFSHKGGIFASAVTTLRFHNPKLARAIWGEDENHNTWEYIYLVNDVKNINIPYSKFNYAVGYAPKFIIQGFNILDDEKSNKLLTEFDLFSNTYVETVSESEFNDAIEKLELEGPLDSKVSSNARKEQAFLREHLFKGKTTCKCGICGKEFPVDMLTTSHIKKRCECTKEEKLDFKNIVMPMCDFGCDRAYENGYIYVDDLGKIRINYKKNPTQDMINTFKAFEGNKCTYFNKDTAKYFEAHRKKFGL